jgi:hypothetical protein
MFNEPWEETDKQLDDIEEEDFLVPENDLLKPPSLSEAPSYEEERSYWQDN